VQTATEDPLVGRVLEGRYRIAYRIARGGMSTVYAAVDQRLEREVAVKVMSSALSADPAFSDRFAREARAAARLSHVNVVSVYDQGVDSGPGGHHVFLVMELVEGRTLRDLIREKGRLSPAEAISIMEPVLSALSAAHRAGIVHRDVKPENILLSDDGLVKVADFGLARAIESDAAATRTGLMMGTVAYCAPEQIARGQSDPRSDVYSAGVVLYELLTGHQPFEGASAMTVAYQHVHSRVPAPSSKVAGIPTQIDELVVSATDSEPGGRPLDAGVFLALVSDARTDLGLPIVPVPARPRGARPPGPRAALRGAPATAPVPAAMTTDVLGRQAGGRYDTSVVGGSHPSAPGMPPTALAAPAKSRKPRRRRRALIVILILLLLGVAAGYGGWWVAAGRYSQVPSVAGESPTAATQDLRTAGYKVDAATTTRFSETVAKGQVLATDPSAGSRVVRGQNVELVISGGKERFTLPSVAGKTETDARTAMALIPIALTRTLAANDTVPKGRVIGTNPAFGTLVKRNQPVVLIVSTGPPIVPVPTVAAGTPWPAAHQAIVKAGFKTKRVEAFNSTIDKGLVISTSPSSGTAVKFSVITVTVSKGPQMVNVPDISAGTPLDTAKRRLTEAGLNYDVKSFSGGASAVLAISPGSGVSVRVGSTVTIYAI